MAHSELVGKSLLEKLLGDGVEWAARSTINIVPGTPVDPQVGDCWFSTNQNTFIIKIA